MATLEYLLITLGLAQASRYSIEETATILGLTPKQVRTQIKKGHLAAIKSSPRRWGGVLHTDLDAYLAAANTKGGE